MVTYFKGPTSLQEEITLGILEVTLLFFKARYSRVMARCALPPPREVLEDSFNKPTDRSVHLILPPGKQDPEHIAPPPVAPGTSAFTLLRASEALTTCQALGLGAMPEDWSTLVPLATPPPAEPEPGAPSWEAMLPTSPTDFSKPSGTLLLSAWPVPPASRTSF